MNFQHFWNYWKISYSILMLEIKSRHLTWVGPLYWTIKVIKKGIMNHIQNYSYKKHFIGSKGLSAGRLHSFCVISVLVLIAAIIIVLFASIEYIIIRFSVVFWRKQWPFQHEGKCFNNEHSRPAKYIVRQWKMIIWRAKSSINWVLQNG